MQIINEIIRKFLDITVYKKASKICRVMKATQSVWNPSQCASASVQLFHQRCIPPR